MAKRTLVDIDTADLTDSENRTFSDSIKSHSQIAEFYKYRPPYVPDFFRCAVEKLGISKSSILLDLCCGRGELASQFSEFCKWVYAIDGSNEMLANSIARENVSYLLRDVNRETIDLPGKADHSIIGTAIHWVQQESLQRIIEQNINAGGKIFIAHTLIRMETKPYFPALASVNAKYGRRPRPVDLWGKEKLAACGYGETVHVRIRREVQFSIEYVYRNQLSHLYRDFYRNVSADFERYRQDIRDALTPYADKGKLTGTLVNWGLVYSPLR